MKAVLVNVSSKEDYLFVRKLYGYFENKGIIPLFFCPNLIIYLYLKSKGEQCFFAKKTKSLKVFDNEILSFNVESGILSEKEASGASNGFYYKIDSIIKKFDIVLMVIPSGRMISHKIMSMFSNNYDIPAIYIGYGNFPGKTFLDCSGTDKSSYLYNNTNILKEYSCDLEKYTVWKDEYIQKKLASHKVPQARVFDSQFLFKRMLRTTVCKIENFLGIAHDINYKYSMLKGKLRSIPLYIDVMNEKNEYVFFPMQLSNDAQIVLNYKYDIFHAVHEAIEISDKYSLPLVVKAHPAEIDPVINKFLNELRDRGKIKISSDNTFSLIKNSNFVVTVNSTVGIESRLLAKRVVFLGDSLFERVPQEYLGNYLMEYLFNLDYFNSDMLSPSDYQKLDMIISRGLSV
jgi:hypothetical protein